MMTKRLVAMLCVVLLAGCVSDSIAPLPKPPKVETLPTTTSIPDFSGTSLPAVGGTTTTAPIAMTGGNVTIHGRVFSAGVPAPGARVRIERFVGDQTTSTEVVAGIDGGYALSGILGGRYRVRAFRPPTESMTQAQVLFLGSNENRALDLALDSVTGDPAVTAAIAPDPPVLGETANVVVRVTSRGVDTLGVIRSIPAPNLPLVLQTAGGRVITSVNPAVTDINGRAVWTVICSALDKQELVVVLPTGTPHPVQVAGCQMPVTTTTEVALTPQTVAAPPRT